MTDGSETAGGRSGTDPAARAQGGARPDPGQPRQAPAGTPHRRLRLMVVSPFLPHPAATHGGAVYLGALLEALARHADVALACFRRRSEARWGLEPPAGLARVELVDLAQNHDLAGWRLLGHRLRLGGAWTLHRLPLLAAKHRSAEMQRRLAVLLREWRPDAALLEFGVMAQYAAALQAQPILAQEAPPAGQAPPAVPIVLTDHESGAPAPHRIGPFGFGRRRDQRLWTVYVQRCYRRAALVQALNADDAARLQELLQRPVAVRPPAVPLPATTVTPERSGPVCLFLGDYSHPPNPEAAAYLATAVLPRIRDVVPEAELWLAGPRAGAAVQALGRLPGVRMLGYVDDVPQLLGRARLCLAPLFSGAGSRIKVLTALAHGLPVVSNALGLRGVGARAPAATAVESAEALAAAAVRLLRDPAAAAAAGHAAREWATAYAGADAVAELQLARVRELVGAP